METLLLRDTRIGQQLAEDWLQSLRDGIVDSSYRDQLAGLDRLALANELNTDAKKLAFWINVYNAFAQIKLGNGMALHGTATRHSTGESNHINPKIRRESAAR